VQHIPLLTGRPTRPRRLLLAAVALLAAPAVVLATPGTADAVTTRQPAPAAAGWLGRQVNPDTHLMETSFGGQSFADYGLTADVVLALDSAKVGRTAARRSTRALERHVLDYTGFGDSKEFYAGAFAKLLVVAAAQGIDPNEFGSGPRRDLAAGLRALECGTAARKDCTTADRGRFADRSAFGDNSNTFTQSLALLGLERATRRGASHTSVTYLIGQQCADGGFPESFGKATCSPTVDATGFAVQALVQVGGSAARTAAAAGGRWLARHQHPNGSFTGNGSRNANSTALAAQALTAVERSKKAAKARHFLSALQVRCGGKPANRGKIHYARVGAGDDARATSQAVPALAQATLSDIGQDGSGPGLPRLAC
jgi:hypothetical protein